VVVTELSWAVVESALEVAVSGPLQVWQAGTMLRNLDDETARTDWGSKRLHRSPTADAIGDRLRPSRTLAVVYLNRSGRRDAQLATG
jgi:hypothetical protein